VFLGHVLQEHVRSTAISGSQPIDIVQAWDAIAFPHPEASFFRGESSGKLGNKPGGAHPGEGVPASAIWVVKDDAESNGANR